MTTGAADDDYWAGSERLRDLAIRAALTGDSLNELLGLDRPHPGRQIERQTRPAAENHKI